MFLLIFLLKEEKGDIIYKELTKFLLILLLRTPPPPTLFK